MGADGEGSDDSDDEESPHPSLSDLAAEVGGTSNESDDDATGDAPDPSFADLILALRGRAGSEAEGVREEEGRRAGRASSARSEAGDTVEDVDWAWRQAGAAAPADGFNLSAETDAVISIIDDATQVLLLGELLCPEEYDVCTKLLGAEIPSNLLLVTLTQSPEERLNVCRGFLGELPGETAIVSVGDPVGSGASAPIPADVAVETIPDPTDLMRIGITITRQLSEFESSDVPTAVCFHSLTALLQLVGDRQAVFRFLHTLRGRMRAADARAHYHLDGGAHDRELVSMLRPLFDVTLRVDDDGNVSVNPDR